MSRRALPFLVLAATTVALAWWVDAPADVDDAAITYRYAENIATGHGFVYNLGESVWGTTAPLFTLLLVPFVAMGVPAQAAALALGLMGAAAAAVLAADLAGRLTGSRVAFWMAGSWSALAAPLSVWAVSGMETLPYAALLLGTWSAHQRQRTHAAAALAGLAWLMRPDGLVIMMALLLSAFSQRTGRGHWRRRSCRAAAGGRQRPRWSR